MDGTSPMGERSRIARTWARWLAASVLALVLLGPPVWGTLAGAAGGGTRFPTRGMRGMGSPPNAMDRRWEPGQSYRSPFDLAFSPEGGAGFPTPDSALGRPTLAVSDRTGRRLYILDAQAGQVVREIELRGQPLGVAWQGDGRVVVSEYDAGAVAEVNAKTGDVLRRFSVGLKPVGVAVAPKRGLVVACDYGLHTVAIVDLTTGRERSRSSCGRHPYFVAVTPDEGMAVVGNLIPVGPATDPISSALISLIDLDSGKNVKNIPLPGGSSNVRQVRVSADGRWAYVVHTQGRTILPTTQVERAWINTNALSIVDLTGKELYATVLLDTINEGAADPWGVALAPDGKTAWVSIAGVQQIAKIELARLHELLAGGGDIESLGPYGTNAGPAAIWQSIRENGGKRGELAYRLSALYAAGLLSRISIPAQCPQAIALSPAGNQLADPGIIFDDLLPADRRPPCDNPVRRESGRILVIALQ